MGVLFGIRVLLLGELIKAPDFWKHPCGDIPPELQSTPAILRFSKCQPCDTNISPSLLPHHALDEQRGNAALLEFLSSCSVSRSARVCSILWH